MHEQKALGEVPYELFSHSMGQRAASIDMNQIVGSHDILMICLDTLRYDAAAEEEALGHTPVLSKPGPWRKCQAAGNFTYPSHHTMFAGFFPCDYEASNISDREFLFFPRKGGLGRVVPPGAYAFSGSTIMEGLEQAGYETWCVGGVSFFDKRTDLGRVFPGMFRKSWWKPAFGCAVKNSTGNQADFILRKLDAVKDEQRIFLYLNVDAIHYPNFFYLEGAHQDSLDSHKAALRYADQELGRLFEGWRSRKRPAFVICLSDHGTCYGEDGCQFHGINHPAVNTVPYKHFVL